MKHHIRRMRIGIAVTSAAFIAAGALAAVAPSAYGRQAATEAMPLTAPAEFVDQADLRWFEVVGARDAAGRQAIADARLAFEGVAGDVTTVVGTADRAAALRAAGYTVNEVENPAAEANRRAAAVEAARGVQGGKSAAAANDFPAGDEAYHTYDEVNAGLRDIASKYPGIAQIFDIGKSAEGRTVYGIKISDNVGKDKGEPEVVQTCNIHAREHLTTEMCMYMAREFTSTYATDERVKNIVNNRVLWIIPIQNPDGSTYDIQGGRYQSWRKNRQRNNDGSYGVDPNRNYPYKWGCCGGSSSVGGDHDYRGPSAESAPETRNLTQFVRSRVIGGKQRITGHIDWHTFSELILSPFAYTEKLTGPDMSSEEREVYKAISKKMSDANGYPTQRFSDMYIGDGISSDWFWGEQKIWSVTVEMYPGNGPGRNHGFYPPASLIPRETTKHREAVLTYLEHADCMWKATGNTSKCSGATTPTATPTTKPTVTPTVTAAPTTTVAPTTTAPTTATPVPTDGLPVFTNTTVQQIADQASVTSTVSSTYAAGKQVRLTANVEHGCGQQLTISLVAPDGTKHVVQEGRRANFWECFQWRAPRDRAFAVTGSSAGTWTLEVTDTAARHTGTLRSWQVAFSG